MLGSRLAARALRAGLTARVSHQPYCSAAAGSTVSVNDQGVATMLWGRKPVNSLSTEFLTEIKTQLDDLHGDRAVKGLVITSSLPNIFSGGIEITEMYQSSEERLQTFWRALQDVWLSLYSSRLVTVAAINGHAPAGGCMLSLTTDLRLMAAGKYTIGLNETLLGIVAPFWFSDMLEQTVGPRHTEWLLQLGHMCGGDEALKLGVVDELVAPEQWDATVEAHVKRWLAVPAEARYLTKMDRRRPLLEKFERLREEDVDHFVSFITKDSVQKSLGAYLAMLSKKKK